jgi:hypothetical protein
MNKKLVSKFLCLMFILAGLGFSVYLPGNQVSAAAARYCNRDGECGPDAICWNHRCFYLKHGE